MKTLSENIQDAMTGSTVTQKDNIKKIKILRTFNLELLNEVEALKEEKNGLNREIKMLEEEKEQLNKKNKNSTYNLLFRDMCVLRGNMVLAQHEESKYRKLYEELKEELSQAFTQQQINIADNDSYLKDLERQIEVSDDKLEKMAAGLEAKDGEIEYYMRELSRLIRENYRLHKKVTAVQKAVN